MKCHGRREKSPEAQHIRTAKRGRPIFVRLTPICASLLALGIGMLPGEVRAQTTVNAIANGVWTDGTTWSDGNPPSAGNSYFIGNGRTVSSLAATGVGAIARPFNGGLLTVGAGGTLRVVSTQTSGTSNITATFGGGLFLDAGASLIDTASVASTTLIRGNVTLANTGTVSFTQASGNFTRTTTIRDTLSGGANISLSINAANGANLNRTFSITGANNPYTGNWTVTSTNASFSTLRLGQLNAGAVNALGTGQVTLNTAALVNGVAGGLNSIAGVTVGNNSLVRLNGSWNAPTAFVNMTGTTANAVQMTLNGANVSANIGNLSGTAQAQIIANSAGNSLTTNITADSIYAGTLREGASGTLAFTKAGPAMLTLTGDNMYSGGTTISSGTLQLGNGGTLGSLAGNVVNNGALAFNRSNALFFDGSISGSGSVSQRGSGTTTLTADNTYAGGTTIDAGTLQLGNGGTSGSIVGDVVNDGALTINRSDAVTLPGVISGSGRLVQAGAGTTILTADNTYTGATTINAGTLQLGNGGVLGSVVGNIVNNSNLVFDRANLYTFAGLISGGGAVEQRGGGTTVFTADNTYSGGTTISAGTLQLGDGGTSGNVAGNIVNNGALAVNHSNDMFFLTPITGSGALVQRGTGRTVLSAANTYTGGTMIEAGMLQVGNGFTSGSIVGDVVNHGMLTFNRSNTLVFDGAISGTGAVTKLGSGATILTANNTYTGGTTIAAGSGTLQLGNGGASGSIVGNVVNDGLLTIDRADTSTLPGTISGSGALSQRGTGTTILTADNTYTGGTSIAAGTLQLGNGGGSGSLLGNVTNNGTLAFNRADTIAFSDIISGTGGVNQLGPGTLQLSGDQTYTGTTQISAGTLALLGSLQSNTVTVAPGATLSGTGVIHGDVINQGRLWPGSAVAGATDYASLTVQGHYVGQNGVLELNTFLRGDGSPSDRLVIDGGTASGTTSILVHNTAPSSAETRSDGILVVSAINGGTTTADAFNLPGEVRRGALDYRLFRGSQDGTQPHNWYLRNEFVVPPPEPEPPEPPQPPDPVLPEDPPPDELPPGRYPIIGPELATYSAVQPLARELGQRTLSTLNDRAGDSTPMAPDTDHGPAAWGRVFGATVDQSYRSFAAPASKGNLSGFQVGVDMWQGQSASGHIDSFGGYLAYGRANVDVRGLVTNTDATGYDMQHTGSLSLQATSVGAYWTHHGPTGWYLDGVAQATTYRGSASTSFARLSLPGTGFIASLEFGYPITLPQLGESFVLEPQLQAIYQYANFSPRNDGQGAVAIGSTHGNTGRAGLRGKWQLTGHNGQLWTPYVRLDLLRDWGGRAKTQFGASGDDFSAVPMVPQATRASLTGGITAQWSPRLSVYGAAGYEHELGNSDNTRRRGFDAHAGLRYAW